jgi:hypothetical protein
MPSLRKALTEFVGNGRRVSNGARLNKRAAADRASAPAMIRGWAAQ